jgi:hypothetical protein
LDKITDFPARSIPLQEAKNMLLNRLICFFELTPNGFLTDKSFKKKNYNLFILQVSKAVIAATIALLVDEGKYISSYKKQAEISKNLDIPKEFHETISFSYGLRLGETEPHQINPQSYWFKARTFFLYSFEQIFLKENSWDNFITIHHKATFSLKEIITKVKDIIRFLIYRERSLNMQNKRVLESSCILSLLSVSQDLSLNKWYLDLVKTRLSKQFDLKADSLSNWDNIKNTISLLWEEYHHVK